MKLREKENNKKKKENIYLFMFCDLNRNDQK